MKRLTWKKPTKERTLMADHRRYMSKCGRYAVVHSHIIYGAGPAGMPDRWYALHIHHYAVGGSKERIIDDFPSQRAAVRCCVEHATKNAELFPAKTKGRRRR
jgi:hypothetical protein